MVRSTSVPEGGARAECLRKRERPDHKESPGVTDREVMDIEERAKPRTPVIYEVVRRLGEEEMGRPIVSLWWSGVAAGLSTSFSLLAEALLYVHLPDASWRPLVIGLGYSVGFLMVVLPVMKQLSVHNLGRLGRIWTIVPAANILDGNAFRCSALHVHAHVDTGIAQRDAGNQPSRDRERLE
jgi:formate-nitrite transporter family protein